MRQYNRDRISLNNADTITRLSDLLEVMERTNIETRKNLDIRNYVRANEGIKKGDRSINKTILVNWHANSRNFRMIFMV